VTDIDFTQRKVQLAQGSRRIPQFRPYDHLVLALGQRTILERFPGFAEHSFCLRDLANAHELRNHVLQCLEHADVTENPDLKRSLLTFVVAGAGFSGVEIAGELHEMLERALPMYPNIQSGELNTILVQRGQQILPELPAKLGDYAAAQLTQRGLTVRYGTSLQHATANAVYTTDGERLPTHTLITTIGNGPTRLIEQLGLPLERGRVIASAQMQVPDLEGVWALGDSAFIPMGADCAPTTAQFALAQAPVLARNIVATQLGQPTRPFNYKPRGTMASIGHYRAVADVFGWRVSGLPAWLLWRAFYIGLLPGFPTRLRVALNWLFDYFLPRSIVQVKTTGQPAARVVHYAAGDVLFAPGQIVDGFYTIIEGTLESRVPQAHQENDFVRVLGPGDHWGERCLTDGNQTLGWLTAVEDCTVLLLQAGDFARLRHGLAPLRDYLDRIPEKIYPPVLRHDLQNDERH
ncbi:MAG: FAD-dependent oxidoreductase, partial [Pseudomonadota bacterium]